MHFYSAKAYNYVRKTWENLLPNPSTIRNCYRVVDGASGFTKEALDAIIMHNNNNSKPLVINLVIDKMAIREQIIFDKERFYDGIDFGTSENVDDDNDSVLTARNALVFMTISLNDNWKVSIAYF